MKYLLDVNVFLAGILDIHPHHEPASAWLTGKSIVLCPIAELGFIRISTNKKVFGATMESARESLARFAQERNAHNIADDLPTLDSHPPTSDQVTDHYLADLASKHGLILATFDEQLKHTSVELIPV